MKKITYFICSSNEMEYKKIDHNKEHKLLQEKAMPGIGAFYRSDLEFHYTTKKKLLRDFADGKLVVLNLARKEILRALSDGELIAVDACIRKDQEPNEDNYECIGEGQYIGFQDAICQTLVDIELLSFLKKHPEYVEKIVGKKKQ